MKDYQKSIAVNKPVRQVYAAITEHIGDWWGNDLTGAAAHIGDSFNIRFGDTRKTFDIVEAIPDQKVVWKCVKAYIDVDELKNKGEWVDTKLHWTFSTVGQGTTLHFLHEGLNQRLECYDLCEDAWNMFLDSLHEFLTTGKGSPYLKPAGKELAG